MTRTTGVTAKDWVKLMQKPHVPGAHLQLATTGDVMNPANAVGVGTYDADAAKAATPAPNPVSIFEGMQTAADIARVNAGYNPLDPTGTGDKAHFLQFTQNIASAPFLSLIQADTTSISQQSHNADDLIDSFVAAFVGIASSDQAQIESSVKSLAKAALSYSGKQESYSNFAQNLLQTDSSGNVEFHLYSSTFQIKSSNNKGYISYESSYEVLRAVYQLSPGSWSAVMQEFENVKKTDTNNWINNMKTPEKTTGGARALCLYK